VDFLARRVMYKAVDNLDLTEGEQPLDFDAGALRPVSVLPPPFPPDLSARENGQVKLVATDQALHLWVTSKSYPGQAVRLDWEDLENIGPLRADGRWKKWSIGGRTRRGVDFRIPLLGRPRPGLVEVLDAYGPGRPVSTPG
jgi:hypothetical protein